MSANMDLYSLYKLLAFIRENNSPFTASKGRRVVKYVDPHIDMRDGMCFSITFRTYSGYINFNTTNENRDDPKSLFNRCIEWLNCDTI